MRTPLISLHHRDNSCTMAVAKSVDIRKVPSTASTNVRRPVARSGQATTPHELSLSRDVEPALSQIKVGVGVYKVR